MTKESEVKNQQQRTARATDLDASRSAAEIHTLCQLIYGELAVSRPWLASMLPVGGSRPGITGGAPNLASPWMQQTVPWTW